MFGLLPIPLEVSAEDVKLIDLNQARLENIVEMDRDEALEMLVSKIGKSDDPAIQAALLNGILLGLEGRRDVAAPSGWGELKANLQANPDSRVPGHVQKLSQVFGDEQATQRAIATLKDSTADPSARKSALASLLAQRRMELLPILEKLIDEEALRTEAIRGFTTIESPTAPALLLKRFPKYDVETQRTVIETLATRKPYAEALLAALDAKTVPRDAIPAYVARTMSTLLGEKFSSKYGVQPLSEDKEAMIAKYKSMATTETLAKADASAGRVVYQKVCMACHVMYGEGGLVGPELTGSNRADLNYLLLNILYPSDDIADAYKMVLVTTKDGQTLAGSIAEEDGQKVVLNMVGQKTTVSKSDIQSRETSPFSMMPAGLLQTLKPEEVVNLFKYMQTKAQVNLPK
tara:strand:- start:8361 stop:9572 length:1212 start_codon:yes stop_codon:yes gene_type:complete